MAIYRVSIWSSLFVEASSIDEAEDVAHDHLIGCLIKPRDFDLDTEIWEGDDDINDIDIVDANKFLTEEKENSNG